MASQSVSTPEGKVQIQEAVKKTSQVWGHLLSLAALFTRAQPVQQAAIKLQVQVQKMPKI